MSRRLTPLVLSAGLLIALFVSSAALMAGPLQRVPNTSLQMPSSPPIFGYTSSNAFGSLVFSNAVNLASGPGETNRLFVVGKNGLIFVITNLANPTRTLFMDISARVTSTVANSGQAGEQGLFSMAIDPLNPTNFYVAYDGQATNGTTGLHWVLSRFSTMPGNTNQGNPNSEVILINQYKRAQNHNGGDMKFGPDGYLYLSVGDEGNEHDTLTNAQHITWRLWSGIMRLDVDKIDPLGLAPNTNSDLTQIYNKSTNYAIPHDNPFVGATTFNGQAVNSNNVQTEFWATGVRNPWKLWLDTNTTTFYCGDVGQDAGSGWEEVNIITKGGNYGWSYVMGTNTAGPNSALTPPGFTQSAPFVAYQTSSSSATGRCIIGGVVYHGTRFSQLNGAYLYGDYVTGNIWALHFSGNTIITNELLLTDPNLTSFGIDPSTGDIVYTDFGTAPSSTVKRIVYNSTVTGTPIPPTLADTGAFTNLMSLTSPQDALQPGAGIVPYDINVPFWSDNAIKSRWFSVPNTNLTIAFNSNANWSFPTGTVWIKHFNLELTNGDPSSEIRLETRLLVKNSSGIYGATYRWGGSQTNATLVNANGLDESFVINDGGNIRTQVWHYPSQAECQACHTAAGGFGLGFRTEQLNKDYSYAGGSTNEIMAYSDAGYFSSSVTNDVHGLLALATATNDSASLEFRARSFLMANCSQCHQPAGTVSAANWDARITTPTALAGLINGALVNNLGDTSNSVIAPQSPAHSVLLTRVSTRAPNSIQMPPLDSNLVDGDATNVITQWILSMTNMFWTATTPNAQSAAPSGSVNYNTTFIATTDLTDTVTFNLSGLPPGASASFNPPAADSSTTNIILTITTSGTPSGVYPLTLTAAGDTQTNTESLSLTVGVVLAAPGTLVWNATNSVSANTNWSTAVNWTNTTAGGNGAPGPQNNLSFNNIGATTSPVANNFVDSSFAVASLTYSNSASSASPNYHVTRINDAQTLLITNGLAVGSAVDAGGANVANAQITGNAGTLVVSNSYIGVEQGSSTAGAHQAVLNLSGLGMLTGANITHITVGVAGSPPESGAGIQRSSGVLYLAKTNIITVTSTGPTNAILVGWNDNQGNNGIGDLGNALYLGQTNAIFCDSVYVGTDKTLGCRLAFNPSGLSSPTAYFRGQNGVNRVPLWSIGDSSTKANSNQNSSGTNDFTGGSVDLQATTMAIGVSQTGVSGSATGNGTGALLFNNGTVDVNNLTNGWSIGTGTTAGTDIGSGAIIVNGPGTLKVNNVLSLAQNTSTGTGIPAGVVNINGGSLLLNTVVAGAGTSSIGLNNATMVLTNSIGTPAAGLGTLATTNSTVHMRLNGTTMSTNIFTTNIVAVGTTTISIDSLTGVNTTTALPLIRYTSFTGSAANFAVGSMPANYAGIVTNNTTAKRIDLIVTHAPATPVIGSAAFAGTNLILTGTSGVPTWTYYILASTNVTLPLSNWSTVQTGFFDNFGSFQVTNGTDPTVPQMFYILQLP
jgi:uncharacterized repeat protein (TIGR03806 family)